MKELTDKERSDIQEAEEARLVNLMFIMHDQLMVYFIMPILLYCRFERIKEYKSHFDHIILN